MANALGEHHGKPVMGASVKITNAGDGLAKPLAAEPRLFPPGALLPVLVWCKVGNEDYDPVEIDGAEDADAEVIGYKLKFNFKAREAFVLDRVAPATLDALVADQRDAVRLYDLEQKRLAAEKKGELTLDGTEHGGPVDGGAPIDTREVGDDDEVDQTGRPDGISDAEWEASARASAVTPIGSKQARKGRGHG